MVTHHNLRTPKPQDRQKHPPRWQGDLNPRQDANFAGARSPRKPATRPASEIKHLVSLLRDFTRGELEEIPVVEPGARLRTGSIYMDLGDAGRRRFKATSDTPAPGRTEFYAPKASVPYPLWNRLLGNADPERTHRRIPPREARQSNRAPRSASRDTTTRTVPQGVTERRGGVERTERRGAAAVGSASGIRARHRRARAH